MFDLSKITSEEAVRQAKIIKAFHKELVRTADDQISQFSPDEAWDILMTWMESKDKESEIIDDGLG